MAFSNPLTFATVVQATTFQLLDPSGNIVSEFGDTGVYQGQPTYGLEFNHLDGVAQPSALRWTTSTPPGSTKPRHMLAITGPADAATVASDEQPAVFLIRQNAPDIQSVGITSGVPVGLSTQQQAYGNYAASASSGRSTATIGADDVVLDSDTAGTLTGVVKLSARDAYLMTSIGTATASGTNVYSAVGATAPVLVPGLIMNVTGCIAGDLLDIEQSLDIRFLGTGVGGSNVYGFVQGFVFVNGVQISPISAYRWAQVIGNFLDGGTYASRLAFLCPTTGIYTVEVRSSANLITAAGGASASVGAAHSSLNVTRYSTR